MRAARNLLLYDRWFRGRPPGRARAAVVLVWIGFLVFPLVTAITNSGPALKHALAIAGAAAFVVTYIWLILIWVDERQRRRPAVLFAILIVIAGALTIGDRSSWGFLFSYSAACAALVVPSAYSFVGVLGCTALAAICCSLGGGSAGVSFGFGASAIGVGLLMVLLRDLRIRNEELSQARAELARIAVAEERERFARDLHDLLGHSLSVIALKAELAGRLIERQPQQATLEVGEVERVARQALSEVRQAVSGYHQPTLGGELAGARMALDAAGVAPVVIAPRVSLAPEAEAVLAWAVREGATNVIRHSGAHRCTITVGDPGSGVATVEVLDDGTGCAGAGGRAGAADGAGGHGLEGLRERAQALGGTVEAGAQEGGGFRLAVSVPAVLGDVAGTPAPACAPLESRSAATPSAVP